MLHCGKSGGCRTWLKCTRTGRVEQRSRAGRVHTKFYITNKVTRTHFLHDTKLYKVKPGAKNGRSAQITYIRNMFILTINVQYVVRVVVRSSLLIMTMTSMISRSAGAAWQFWGAEMANQSYLGLQQTSTG